MPYESFVVNHNTKNRKSPDRIAEKQKNNAIIIIIILVFVIAKISVNRNTDNELLSILLGFNKKSKKGKTEAMVTISRKEETSISIIAYKSCIFLLRLKNFFNCNSRLNILFDIIVPI